MHLAGAFLQINLHCIHGTSFSSVLALPGNLIHRAVLYWLNYIKTYILIYIFLNFENQFRDPWEPMTFGIINVINLTFSYTKFEYPNNQMRCKHYSLCEDFFSKNHLNFSLFLFVFHQRKKVFAMTSWVVFHFLLNSMFLPKMSIANNSSIKWLIRIISKSL